MMKEKQAVKVPSYVAKFLDDVYNHRYGILEIMNRLLEIHEEYFNAEVYNETDYRYVKIASWVENLRIAMIHTIICSCCFQIFIEMVMSQLKERKSLLFMM